VSPATIDATTLDNARRFFEERGASGCEGTAMLAATTGGPVDRLVIPDQVAHPVPRCWVEVTTAGKLELAASLGIDERYVARIHSHPALAFHSPADNANPALTFEGALSIVVPFFGLGLRHGLDACAVLVLEGGTWVNLPSGRVRDQVVVVR
jgi:hypothetical protein